MTKFDFHFEDIVEHARDVVVVTKAFPFEKPGPEIVYVNRAFTKLTGYTFDEAVGQNPRILQSHDTSEEGKRAIKDALKKQKPVRVTLKNYSKSGESYWLDISILPLKNDQGEVTHFAAIERDVSAQKLLEQKLETLSKMDHLTGLLNRRQFDEHLKNEFVSFKLNNSKYTLLMLDIDNFKNVNDTFGHSAGDEVLQNVSRIMAASLRSSDNLYRFGGEEFCVILANTSITDVAHIAEKLRKNISDTPAIHETQRIDVTVSIGASEVIEADSDCYDAFKRADHKLYEAKSSGRNKIYL